MLSETVFEGTLGRERIDKDFLFQAFDDGSLNRMTRKEEVEIGWRRRRRRRMSQTNSGGDASLLPSPRTLSPTRKGCFCRSAASILVLVLIT